MASINPGSNSSVAVIGNNGNSEQDADVPQWQKALLSPRKAVATASAAAASPNPLHGCSPQKKREVQLQVVQFMLGGKAKAWTVHDVFALYGWLKSPCTMEFQGELFRLPGCRLLYQNRVKDAYRNQGVAEECQVAQVNHEKPFWFFIGTTGDEVGDHDKITAAVDQFQRLVDGAPDTSKVNVVYRVKTTSVEITEDLMTGLLALRTLM